MNNHPRFSCKHAWKHRKPIEKHRCTLCAGRHPPFLCPIAQVNGGKAQPNWYKCEYKPAKQENREADYRWGPDQVTQTDVDDPLEGSQVPAEAPQPQCTAAAMMHGVSKPPMSSYQGGCPTIAEHQELMPPMQPPMKPPMQPSMQPEVIPPNPGYKIAANLWELEIPRSAREPGPLASFLRHCNTMESPYYPTYSKGGGATQPADDISNLDHHRASMENLRELQKYSEKLQFEATCCRLWSGGIQTQIMDEQERIQSWISGMTEELIRMKRIQPPWIQQMQNQGCPAAPSMPMIGPSSQPQPASSSSASMVPVKPAPMPRNAPFPSMMGADPWAEAKLKHQQK